jgi:hypothetical protein
MPLSSVQAPLHLQASSWVGKPGPCVTWTCKTWLILKAETSPLTSDDCLCPSRVSNVLQEGIALLP